MSEFVWSQEEIDKFFSSHKGKEYKEIMKNAYKNDLSHEKVSKNLKELQNKYDTI